MRRAEALKSILQPYTFRLTNIENDARKTKFNSLLRCAWSLLQGHFDVDSIALLVGLLHERRSALVPGNHQIAYAERLCRWHNRTAPLYEDAAPCGCGDQEHGQKKNRFPNVREHFARLKQSMVLCQTESAARRSPGPFPLQVKSKQKKRQAYRWPSLCLLPGPAATKRLKAHPALSRSSQ